MVCSFRHWILNFSDRFYGMTEIKIFQEAARVMAWLRCKSEEDQSVKNELEIIKKEQINDTESSRFLLKAICKQIFLITFDKISTRQFSAG